MVFNLENLTELNETLSNYGFVMEIKSNISASFISSDLVVSLVHNPKENTTSLWLKGSNSNEIEINNKVISEHFDSEIKISTYSTESFIKSLLLFFNTAGKCILVSPNEAMLKLINYNEQSSYNYTEQIITEQIIKSAENAWNMGNYNDFINQINKLDEKALSETLKKKLSFARDKLQ